MAFHVVSTSYHAGMQLSSESALRYGYDPVLRYTLHRLVQVHAEQVQLRCAVS